MSPLSHRIAISALLGATFLTTPLSVAFADDSTATAAPSQMMSHHHHDGAGDAKMKGETVEQRISNLHKELKITADEETNWSGVAQAMRDNAAATQTLIAEKMAQNPKGMTAVDDLKSYEKFAQAHVDGLKNLISSFQTLYDSMPDLQKKLADHVFQNFAHKGPRSHG
jgi:hypothetical protein